MVPGSIASEQRPFLLLLAGLLDGFRKVGLPITLGFLLVPR
jgi:hypothetical protein